MPSKPKQESVLRWGVLWRSRNRLDGLTEHLLWECGLPITFRSREDARAHIEAKYGYIRTRPDLLKEPHGWKIPRVVRLRIVATVVGRR